MSMLKKHQLTGPYFNKWFCALKLVVLTEKLHDVFETALSPARAAGADAQALADWVVLFYRYNEVACLMLETMSPRLYHLFKHNSPLEMVTELQKMYGKPSGVELQELVNMFHSSELMKKKKKTRGQNVASTSSDIYTIDLFAFPKNSWVYDTGCGTHVCNIKHGLRGAKKLKRGSLYFNKRTKSNLVSTYLWHCRLAHINEKRIEKLQHDGLLKSTDNEPFDQCVSFISGKMIRKSFSHKNEKVKDVLGLIHTDVCGPLRHVSNKEMKRMQNVPYASVVGSIMYAVRCTRPDVTFAQNITRRFQQNSGDTKSQTRYVFILNGGAVVWKSLKQSTTAQHVTEDEYIASSEAAKEAVWIRKFIDELGVVPLNNYLIKMNCDNSAAIIMAKESGIQKGAKQFKTKYHYVCECIETGEINIVKVYTRDNLDDLCMKALAGPKLTQQAKSMGLRLASSFIDEAYAECFLCFGCRIYYVCYETDVKNILKYLRNIKDTFLVNGGDPEAELRVNCYCHAGFETDIGDTKSQTGYVFILNGGTVVWKSFKQSTTAQHVTEAAASEAEKKAVWIRKFIDELGVVPSNNYLIKMNCDNSAAIIMAKESGIQKGAKQFKRKYHYVCECIETG
nr:hypothetical protein [Tanacetum cinerariifolium]